MDRCKEPLSAANQELGTRKQAPYMIYRVGLLLQDFDSVIYSYLEYSKQKRTVNIVNVGAFFTIVSTGSQLPQNAIQYAVESRLHVS